MPGNEDVIITGGRASGEYWAEYQGRKVQLTGWRLFVTRRVAAWVYRYFA
jgi:hypothetical protein